VVALLTGCTDEPTASAEPGTSTSPEPTGAGPGQAATTYPVPADAQAAALPDLGTAVAGTLTLTLNAVRRVSDEALVVEGTLTASKNTVLTDLAEVGYKVREVNGETPFTYEFSAVSVAVPGDPVVYLPMRDEKGFCACTQGILGIDGGESIGVYTYVSAPPDASSVTVNVAQFAPFVDVPVSS
jgi:hypothetical protein